MLEYSAIPYISRESCIVIYDKDLSDKLVRACRRNVELSYTSPTPSHNLLACCSLQVRKNNLVLSLKEKNMEKLVCWNIREEEGWGGWSKYEHEHKSSSLVTERSSWIFISVLDCYSIYNWDFLWDHRKKQELTKFWRNYFQVYLRQWKEKERPTRRPHNLTSSIWSLQGEHSSAIRI